MKTLVRLACGLLLGVAWLPATAVAQDGLYAAEVPVAGEDADERNRAIRQAMQGVLVKLTGSREAPNRPGVAAILEVAPALVQQFRYRVEPGAPDAAPTRYLWAQFDPAAVDRLAAQEGWRIWQPPRPRLLVWLTTEQLGQRQLVNLDATPEAAAALRGQAQARGIPLQWPLLDLEDQTRVTAADLWGGFEDGIRAASARYGEGPVLLGRLKAQPRGAWRPEWVLYDHTGAQSFGGASGPLAEVLTEGVDLASDLLAGRYAPAVAAAAAAPVRVRVQGILTVQDYADAIALVGGAPGVTRISLRGASGEGLSFDVWLEGDAAYLAQGLSLDPRLQRAAGGAVMPGVEQLSYYWSP